MNNVISPHVLLCSTIVQPQCVIGDSFCAAIVPPQDLLSLCSGTFQRLSFNSINDHKTDSDIRFYFILDFEYWIKSFLKMKLSNVTPAVQNWSILD